MTSLEWVLVTWNGVLTVAVGLTTLRISRETDAREHLAMRIDNLQERVERGENRAFSSASRLEERVITLAAILGYNWEKIDGE